MSDNKIEIADVPMANQFRNFINALSDVKHRAFLEIFRYCPSNVDAFKSTPFDIKNLKTRSDYQSFVDLLDSSEQQCFSDFIDAISDVKHMTYSQIYEGKGFGILFKNEIPSCHITTGDNENIIIGVLPKTITTPA